MFSELECGICYRTYNAGRRCPRELHCKHGFCESCLLALSRPHGPEEARPGAAAAAAGTGTGTTTTAAALIVCPLCRHTTSVSGEGKLRAELRVNECVLERLLAAGVLDKEEEEEEQEDGQVRDGCEDSEEATLPENDAEDSDSSAGSSGGRLRRSWRKVWRKISGKRRRQRGGENCVTNEDIRNLAMMSCYMF